MFRCAKCREVLPADSFRPNPKMKSGVHSWCKPCTVASTREWRIKNQERVRRDRRAHRLANLEKYRRLEFEQMRRRYPLVPKDCARCGRNFTPVRRNSQRYCLPECQKRNHWESRTPVHHHIRQKVLARDQWRCYLCQRDIDRTVKWPHPMSGTIDHVVPYSVSQNNHPDNLRAAHWHCNYDKGDSLPGTEVWVPAEAA